MSYLKVWNFTDPLLHPADGNLSRMPNFDLAQYFVKDEVVEYGLKKSVTFYLAYEDKEFIEPLCKITWDTNYSDDGVPSSQDKQTSWMKSDESWGEPFKQTSPIINPKVFLQTMRSRIIEELIDLADKFGLGDKLKALYEKHAQEIYIYKEGGSPKFKEAIAASKEKWLDGQSSVKGKSVRDIIVQYLSIGLAQ